MIGKDEFLLARLEPPLDLMDQLLMLIKVQNWLVLKLDQVEGTWQDASMVRESSLSGTSGATGEQFGCCIGRKILCI
jgi:hypothetical protein